MSAVIKLSSPATHEFWEIPVLLEDEHLLALDKPAGLLISPDRYDPDRPNLMKLLHAAIAAGKPWVRERGLSYLSNAHRLDFETSGVLLLAKSKPVLMALADLFGTTRVHKEYLALVHGQPEQDQFEIHAPLAAHPTRPGLMRVDPKHGKKSSTVCEVLERFRGYTLLRCRLLTGRTHQARVHLRHAGLPLVGDALYGGQPLLLSQLKTEYRLKPGQTERPLIARPALHAARLSLPHPVTGLMIEIQSPWPKDLKVAVKYLRRFAAVNAAPDAPARATL